LVRTKALNNGNDCPYNHYHLVPKKERKKVKKGRDKKKKNTRGHS
jgi:hypothetical protein